MKNKTTLTYKLLCAMGFKYPIEDYGDVSIWKVIKQFFTNWHHRALVNAMNCAMLEPFNPRKLRPFILRKLGAQVGKDVFIGDYVRVDLNHSNLLILRMGFISQEMFVCSAIKKIFLLMAQEKYMVCSHISMAKFTCVKIVQSEQDVSLCQVSLLVRER